MRKLVTAMLLLLMMTCIAFAEDDPAQEPAAEPDVIATGDDDPEEPMTPIDLSTVVLTLQTNTYEATGSAITPDAALTQDGQPLTDLAKDIDYDLVYENNVNPGTATVKAVAREGENAKCTHATQPVEFKITAIPLNKITMTLSKMSYYKTGSEIKPVPMLTYGSETLVNGKDYTLKYTNNINVGTGTVTAVFAAGGRFEAGSKSMNFTVLSAKPRAAAVTSIKSIKPNVVVKWRTVSCTGYQLQVSRNSDFSKATSYNLTATTKKVPKLKHNIKYYFRVRAYTSENGKTTYGDWSKSSAKVKTTGAVGNKYSKDGAYIKNKTIKLDGNYYYYNISGVKSGCSKTMWDYVKNSKSKTKYLIAVDCSKNRTCIYEGKKGSWKLKSYWKCTTGKKSTPTIKGSFKVCGKVSHFGEQKGYSVWYATRIKYEYYFHSILYKPYSKTKVLSGALGKNLSHGCIRLAKKNAQWIYKNCKSGTKIVIY